MSHSIHEVQRFPGGSERTCQALTAAHRERWAFGEMSSTRPFAAESVSYVQAEQLSQHAGEVSQLEAQVEELQWSCSQGAHETEALAAQLQAEAEALREAERMTANQQAKLEQQQQQAQEATKAADKVGTLSLPTPHTEHGSTC